MLKTNHTNIFDMYKAVKSNGFDSMSVREKLDIALGYPRVSLLLLSTDVNNEEEVDGEFSRVEYFEAYAERTASDSDIENAFFGLEVAQIDDLANSISDETKENMKEFYTDVLSTAVEMTNRHPKDDIFCSTIAFGVVMMDPALVDAMSYGLDIIDLIPQAESKVMKEILQSLNDNTLDDTKWNDLVKKSLASI